MNKAVIFDLDGTIYFGNTIAEFALKVLDELDAMDYKILFFTNNSTKTRKEIFDKLQTLGIKTEINKVYTSSFATVQYLRDNSLQNIYLIGSSSFKEETQNAGIKIVSGKDADAVVIGLDFDFNYEKISEALVAIEYGAKIIACNVDKNYPIENKILKPGCNSMVMSIIASSDKKNSVDYIVGKPNTYLLELMCKEWNLNKDEIYVVGDSIDSDIAMANNYGVKNFLVHSNGKSLEDFINKIKE